MSASSNRVIGNLKDIEGSLFVKNYIGNDGANTNTAGWATYADAAGTSPVDGTGGSPTVTFTRSTSSPLSNDASFIITKDAANRQGQGASYDFTIDSADKAKLLTIEFDYESASPFAASSGTTDSDIEIYLYDVTNASLIPVTDKYITGLGNFKFQGIFQSSASSTSYRLIFHVATTNASAWTLKLDNVKVYRCNQSVLGAAMTDWVSYTPTTTGWGTPTSVSVYYRRVGDSIQVNANLKLGTTTATDATLSLPTGLLIDTSKISTNTVGSNVGTFVVAPRGGGSLTYLGNYAGIVLFDGSATDKIYFGKETGTTVISKLQGNDYSSGQTITFSFIVPIQGWSSYAGSISSPQAQSEVRLQGNAGYGSTNTRIVRFTNTERNVGSAITYATSSTLGDTFTINESGLYSIYFSHGDTVATYQIGISRNSSQLSTDIQLITANDILAASGRVAGYVGIASTTVYLTAGDIIRAHTENQLNGTTSSAVVKFQIAKVANNPTLSQQGTVAIKYNGTTAQTVNGTPGDVVFNTKVFDTHNAYNATTGVFTVPVSGKYRVSACVVASAFSMSTSQFIEFKSKKNSTLQYMDIIYGNGTSESWSVNGDDTFDCVAGDTISVQMNSTNTFSLVSNTTFSRISIEKFG